MNVLLWVLQGLLAVHTAIGAVWKFSHSAPETMPSLAAIPSWVWLAMSGMELVCSLLLILPAFSAALALLAPIGAAVIAFEMLVFCALHLYAGEGANFGPMIYWMSVAAVGVFIAYFRCPFLK